MHDPLEQVHAVLPLRRVARQEHHPYPVVAGIRKVDLQVRASGPQELVRELHQDARAVAGLRIAAARSPMRQVSEDR